MKMTRTGLCVTLLVGLLVSCGGGGGSDPEDTAEVSTDTSDADAPDAPTLVVTYPGDGDTDIPLTVTFELVFSHAMRPGVGSLTVAAVDDIRDADVGQGEWVDARTWRWRPPVGLQPATHYDASLRDFESTEGAAVAITSFGFDTVAADSAPYVVRTVPDEGAVDVAALAANVEIEFSKPVV